MSATYQVQGGVPLVGTVALTGAKNAASKILLATMLSAEPSVIDNVPLLGETDIAAELIGQFGGQVNRAEHRWTVATPAIATSRISALSRKNRLPILTLGILLNRVGHAEVPIVGGDAIGPRPVNFHLAALRAMGAVIDVTPTSFQAKAERLHGVEITLPYPSVGATESIALAAVLADGQTTIHNAAIEPEVMDLLAMLRSMGAVMEFRDQRTLVIDGVSKLHGTTYRVIPDRIEAASFACLALATGGDIFVTDARPQDLASFLQILEQMNGCVEIRDNGIRFWRARALRAVKVETDTHPGYMTDWQQPLVTVMTQAEGISTVHETVYEDRFGYTKTLVAMGADITTSTECWGTLPCRWSSGQCVHSCQVTGPRPLHSATIDIPDIRAGMAHLIAALTASGESTLHGVEHLDRGYQDLSTRLQALGARLKRQT